MNIMRSSSEPPTLRIRKSLEKLTGFQFDLHFKPGREMKICDFLSRSHNPKDIPGSRIRPNDRPSQNMGSGRPRSDDRGERSGRRDRSPSSYKEDIVLHNGRGNGRRINRFRRFRIFSRFRGRIGSVRRHRRRVRIFWNSRQR